jgi:bacterioferritin (cytochrome b1)
MRFVMEEKSEAEQQAIDAQRKDQAEAGKVSNEAWKRAYHAYKEAKKQAHIVHKKARKIAVDKQAKKEANEAYKKAIEQAKKLRDAITKEAMVVFRCSYDKADADYLETQIKSQNAIKDADETYKEAKKQADIVYEKAKKRAVDKQAKKEANEAYKKAIEQAKQVRDETTRKLRQGRNP